MTGPAVSKIERTELLVDQVHDRLQRAILNRELPDSRRQLPAILDTPERVVAGSNIAAPVEPDMACSKLVREIASNADRTTLLNRIQGRSHLALNTRWRERATSRGSRDEHCEIPAAIAGDPETAEQTARRHIAAARTRIAGAFTTDEKRRTIA